MITQVDGRLWLAEENGELFAFISHQVTSMKAKKDGADWEIEVFMTSGNSFSFAVPNEAAARALITRTGLYPR